MSLLKLQHVTLAAVFSVCTTIFNTSLAFAQSLPATRVASGLDLPVYSTHAPGDPDRIFIVEQRTGPGDDTGRVRILNRTTGQLNPQPFLTIPNMDNASEEQGLLSLAFHPNYETNGYFYVTESYIGHTDIVRYQASSSDVAIQNSATTILTYSQPHNCHNGNWLGFGPDGMLYHTSGDGGSQHDGFDNAQNKTTLNGSILRIDVGTDGLADDFPDAPNQNYAIPATNPFVGEGGGVREELWAIGLRNPWRASFDRETGDLWIGDTSQDTLELINFQHADNNGDQGGHNYGWPLREGTIPTPTGGVGGPKPPGAIDPIYEYLHLEEEGTIGAATALGHNQGNSVTGGYVYRGPNKALQGKYIFGDFISKRIWSIEFDGTSDSTTFDGTQAGASYIDWTPRIDPDVGSIDFISSFGEDYDGNLYVMDYFGGELFMLNPNFQDADFDLDGDVDGDDFLIWQSAFGIDTTGDADKDGDTDGDDFLIWQSQFGSGSGSTAVPEPASVILTLLSLIAVCLHQKVRGRR